MNCYLKYEKLEHLLICGIHLKFSKPFDENSFKSFINTNSEYKNILKYFPLFCEYFSWLYYLNKDRFTYILENVIESMVN